MGAYSADVCGERKLAANESLAGRHRYRLDIEENRGANQERNPTRCWTGVELRIITMKKLFTMAVAATALTAISAPAAAQTNTNHYKGSILGLEANNPNSVAQFFVWDPAVSNNLATQYTATADAADDTETAEQSISRAFTLRGNVSRDCSFYTGNNEAARTIDFGQIGIQTGDNENDDTAFEMVDDLEAEITTVTAGCNTNSEVRISKNDIRGLVNNSGFGYDTNEFTANIPYSVTANWTGVNVGQVAAGTPQTLTLAANANESFKTQGAWRSRMSIDVNAQRINDRGLISGVYEGVMTVSLSAI